jgi:hypothetical protein
MPSFYSYFKVIYTFFQRNMISQNTFVIGHSLFAGQVYSIAP